MVKSTFGQATVIVTAMIPITRETERNRDGDGDVAEAEGERGCGHKTSHRTRRVTESGRHVARGVSLLSLFCKGRTATASRFQFSD